MKYWKNFNFQHEFTIFKLPMLIDAFQWVEIQSLLHLMQNVNGDNNNIFNIYIQIGEDSEKLKDQINFILGLTDRNEAWFCLKL